MKSTPRSRRGRTARGPGAVSQSFFIVILQMIAVDLIFSLDSIITAIGMVQGHRDHDRGGRASP